MKENYSEKTTKDKNVYIVMRIIRIVFWVCVVYFAFLSFQAGEYISKPLAVGLLMVPVGIYNILSHRKRFQGSDGERKQFNKIVVRSVILAPIIVIVFLTVTVLIMLKTD